MKTDEIEWPNLVPEIYVSSIDQSIDFYTKILGFEVLYGRKEEKFSYINFQGSHFMLAEFNPYNDPWVVGKLEKPFGRGVSFQLTVTDAKAIYNRVKENNCEIFLDYHKEKYKSDDTLFVVEQFIIVDPDGYLLRFQQDIGEEAA